MTEIATFVYALCAVTSLACAILLLRAYFPSRVRLLFWAGIGFVGLTISNLLMFTDFVVLPDLDLSPFRALMTSLSIGVLLFGLLWEGD